MKLYNLEQHNAQTKRHVSTPAHNVPYAIAKAMKNRLEMSPKLPGTFWKIVENARKVAVMILVVVLLAACGSTKKPHCPTYAFVVPIEVQPVAVAPADSAAHEIKQRKMLRAATKASAAIALIMLVNGLGAN